MGAACLVRSNYSLRAKARLCGATGADNANPEDTSTSRATGPCSIFVAKAFARLTMVLQIDMASVLDFVSQICDVILVRRTFGSGKPQGVGILGWGGNGEGMEAGRSVYEPPGTKVDGILSQQGGSK
jgi:hypothetical protein